MTARTDVDPTREAPRPESVAQVLRTSGFRATRGRLDVHRALWEMGGHRGADEVHGRLAGNGVRVARSSVYAALEVLASCGLVMVADAGPGRTLYEAGGLWHHHARCRVCGEVSDVRCVVGAKPCLEAGGAWGEVDEAQVIFRGTCRRCAATERRRPAGERSRGEESPGRKEPR